MTQSPVAALFPGQGSQSVGMLTDLVKQMPQLQQIYQQAASVLGYDLWQLTQQGPADQLNQTQITQPAMLTAAMVCWQAWRSHYDVPVSVLAGHSLGEYTALVVAGSLTFIDALKLVAERGRLMQETMPDGMGAMAAVIGLTDQQVETVCQQAQQNQIVAPANFNSPGQVVIAGHTQAVQRAIELAQQQGAKLAKLIPVSVPCHCDLLKPAADAFQQILANTAIVAPNIPVLANVDATEHKHPDDIRQSLYQQLFSPVRWVSIIEQMKQQGISQWVELGPGRVLTGLNRRIDRTMTIQPIYDVATLTAYTPQ
ncbi:MAG: ACP S-malonyltransferase [Legionellales bacterium]|nr:ACP S-malonyltransferase [Legionellales bacterium]